MAFREVNIVTPPRGTLTRVTEWTHKSMSRRRGSPIQPTKEELKADQIALNAMKKQAREVEAKVRRDHAKKEDMAENALLDIREEFDSRMGRIEKLLERLVGEDQDG